MKRATQALPLAVLVATALAQTNTVVGSDPDIEGTTTITYSVCPTAATLTTTLSSTITLCPGPNCNGGAPEVTLAPGEGETIVGYTTVGPNGESTVYETVYPQTCLTGMADVTYMITEACPCEATRAADYVPSGFSTTVATVLTSACDTCEASETTITITTPCSTGAYATAGVTNTGAAPGAATGAETASPNAGSPAGGAATGADAMSAAQPAASGAAGGNSGAGASAPGAGGSSAATGMAASGNNSTVSPPITPVGGNVASDVGQNPATFTGAAQKIDIVGFAASAAFTVFVGAAAWWL